MFLIEYLVKYTITVGSQVYLTLHDVINWDTSFFIFWEQNKGKIRFRVKYLSKKILSRLKTMKSSIRYQWCHYPWLRMDTR